MTDTIKQEFTRRISQANSTEMVVILYEITLEHLQDVKSAFEAGDQKSAIKSISRVRSCINELIGSLHFDYEPAGNLLQLYIYCSKLLTEVSRGQDLQALAQVATILGKLHDAYAQIADQNVGGPVMGNAQSVYAGLTYGKGTLNENVVGLGGNRGFLA